MLPFIQNGHSTTLFLHGRPFTVPDTHRHYQSILEKLEAGDDEGFEELIAPPIVQALQDQEEFSIREGVLCYHGEPQIGNYLADKIAQLWELGKPVEAALNFFRKLMNNPSNRVYEELYKFMEQNEMPLTPAGNFLAYKRIRENYMDLHSGTIDNHVGANPKLPRIKVDDNPNNTCSHGLHVCAFNYLANFSGERVVVCEVNPADVVAIPTDYNHTKMRVTEYKVVGEIPLSTAQHIWASRPVVEDYFEPESNDDYEPYNENIEDENEEFDY
jgi:hypothetical protein